MGARRALPVEKSRALATLVVALAVSGIYASNLWFAVREHPRETIATFASHPLIVASRWIDANMPEDTVVVRAWC